VIFTNGAGRADVVYGEPELLDAIRRRPDLQLRMPSLLSLDAVPPDPDALERSLFDLAATRELADVFVPTPAWHHAVATLRAHNFLVLTGPPEMGKTAIARMLGLAQLTSGWEVHECIRPEQVAERFDRERPQLFIADDAFGSTEYRPDAAEHWATHLDRILRATDEQHWLVWTSRPAPLRAGLRRLHRERGGERFPDPAAVQVDAAALGPEEKTLILYRHACAANLGEEQRRLIRNHGSTIVEHPHFTPERIRRFIARTCTRRTSRRRSRPSCGSRRRRWPPRSRRSTTSTASCCWRCSTPRPGRSASATSRTRCAATPRAACRRRRAISSIG
jgi:hypothetical protein